MEVPYAYLLILLFMLFLKTKDIFINIITKNWKNRNNNLFTYLQQAYKKYVKFQEKISRFSGYAIIL